MTCPFRFLVLAAALGLACGSAQAAPSRFLETELNDLLTKVSDALESDAAIKGRTISLGRIGSDERPDSNYAPELRRIFEERLKGKLIPAGDLKMTVEYDVADAENDVANGAASGMKMKVLLIRVIIRDSKKRELFNKSAEVNETADIARVMGLTVAPPPTGNQAERNKAVDEAFNLNQGKQPGAVRPTFQVRNETQIGIPGANRFFVEILVKDAPDGPAKPVKPVPNALGNAFVDIKGNQFYEVKLHNNDDFDCVARVRVDGQDAMNRFNADGVQYPGLLIAKNSQGVLKGWMHTVKPRPVEKDNVFSFKVREYAFGSGASIPANGEVGVISVQFAVAWKVGENRPAGRSIGRETEQGPGLEENFKIEPRNIGDFNETISIRYSPSAK